MVFLFDKTDLTNEIMLVNGNVNGFDLPEVSIDL